jgi:RHS repeat-associated protein
VVTKRFFPQGMKVVTGPTTGNYFYSRDHLGSIRELTDNAGNVRARYAYDPWGRRTKLAGDLETDFGFAGMFWSAEANLSLTHFRAYDPELGRWLSRDPLPGAEISQGANLYAYVRNDPVNHIDPLGLMSTLKACLTPVNAAACLEAGIVVGEVGGAGGAAGGGAAATCAVAEAGAVTAEIGVATTEMAVVGIEAEVAAGELAVVAAEAEVVAGELAVVGAEAGAVSAEASIVVEGVAFIPEGSVVLRTGTAAQQWYHATLQALSAERNAMTLEQLGASTRRVYWEMVRLFGSRGF